MTLVDLRGKIGVSGEVGCTPTASGELGLETGLLGGVINDGEAGELGASGILGVVGIDSGVAILGGLLLSG